MDSVSDIIGAKYATQEYVDDGLTLKADKTYVDESKFNRGNIPAPSAGGDANLLDLLGAYNFTNASMPNTPTGIGTILNLPIGSAKTQLFVNWNTPALYIRRQSTSGSWTDWVKFASMSNLANLATKSELANFATKDELAAIGGSSPRSVSGTKIVPLSITAPGTTKLEPAASGAVRWVRKWAHMPKRVRVHISNWHPANNMSGGGNVAIYGRLGPADEQGNFRRSSLIFSSKVIPGDKTELVSQWVTVGANEGEHLGLSIGWTGASGDMYMMQGGGWRKDTSSGWGNTTRDETWTWAQETPFYVWIEAEVPTTAPVVMVNGDSISIGTASSNPVTDGWASVYAREQNALPVLFSQHGSSMTSWKTTSNRWNNLYPGADVQPDAIITALGQNDLGASGMNLDTLQTRYEAVRQSYLDRWPEVPVYIAGVTPSTKSSAVEVIRRDFNTWLATYPFGERGFFDFSAAVGSTDDEALAPEYSADGLHPNTAGQQVLGELVASHPVTPYVATEQQLKTLKAVGEHE